MRSTLDVDDLVGVFPLAVNWFYTVTKQVGYLDWEFPLGVAFCKQDSGSEPAGEIPGEYQWRCVCGTSKEQDVFPNDKMFNSDIAAIVSMAWTPQFSL